MSSLAEDWHDLDSELKEATNLALVVTHPGVQPETNAHWHNLLDNGKLARCLTELLKPNVDVDDKLGAVTQTCWWRLKSSLAAMCLKIYCRSKPWFDAQSDDEGDQFDFDRFLARVCSHFAAGLAAYWARRTKDVVGQEQFLFWLGQAAGCASPAMADVDWKAEAPQVVRAAAGQLVGPFPPYRSAADARGTVLIWLNGQKPVPGRRERQLPVVTAPRSSSGTGRLHDLTLTFLDGCDGVIEDPRLWNRPLGQGFCDSIAQAWAAQHAARPHPACAGSSPAGTGRTRACWSAARSGCRPMSALRPFAATSTSTPKSS